MDYLKFTTGNAKINKFTAIFDLVAGYSCPFAKLCLSKADRYTGKITDGKYTKFRCFSASSEGLRKKARALRWYNYLLLQHADNLTELIYNSIVNTEVKYALRFRLHTSGDFFSQEYFDSWLEVIKKLPDIIFYAYTKALPFWVKRINEIPDNFILTASKGGTHDRLINEFNLRYAEVVFSEEEAEAKWLEIDHDDSLASKQGEPFALLLHGVQPASSEASKANELLKKKGILGYSRDKNKRVFVEV